MVHALFGRQYRLSAVSIAALAMIFTIVPARAQFGNPGFMTPDSAKPAPAANVPNPTDRLFVLLVGQGGLAEMDLARLADGKARNNKVRQFARHMLEDHGQAHQRLGSAAQGAALPMPNAPAPDQQAQRQHLANLADGPLFEQAYLRGQLVEHQKAVQLLVWELNSGQIGPLQQHAAATLPTVLDHLEQVQQLLGELTGAAIRDLAPGMKPRLQDASQ
jgi:putative membrane protein